MSHCYIFCRQIHQYARIGGGGHCHKYCPTFIPLPTYKPTVDSSSLCLQNLRSFIKTFLLIVDIPKIFFNFLLVTNPGALFEILLPQILFNIPVFTFNMSSLCLQN